MSTTPERQPRLKEAKSYNEILNDVPQSVAFARMEAENSGMADTPESKFVLTYLFAARNLLRPVLSQEHIHRDLLQPIGGHGYNPQRNIDEIGQAIANEISTHTTDMNNYWIRTEENAVWKPGSAREQAFDTADRFIFIDPMDETNAIAEGKRYQTTGIAVYTRSGDLLTLGVISLVDDGIIFFPTNEDDNGTYMFPSDSVRPYASPDHEKIRFATLKRRMHMLKDLPIVQHGVWAMDSIGGFAVCAMASGSVDVILDQTKGNPWFEYILWGPAAEKAGFIVSDPDGKPIDTAAIVRRAIEKNPDDSFRIPFVISRNEAIHRNALSLLKKENSASEQ